MPYTCDRCGDPSSGCACNYVTVKEVKKSPPVLSNQPVLAGIPPPSSCSHCMKKPPETKCGINNCGFWFCSRECNDKHFHARFH